MFTSTVKKWTLGWRVMKKRSHQSHNLTFSLIRVIDSAELTKQLQITKAALKEDVEQNPL